MTPNNPHYPEQVSPNADPERVIDPPLPEGALRIYAFARALNLTVDQLVALLESYDLHILSGRYEP